MSSRTSIYSGLLSLLLFSGCREEFEKRFLLYSSQITPVDAATVAISTELVDRQEQSIVSYGYCWSTDPSPTTAHDTTKLSGGFDKTFQGRLKNLNPGTQYYVRAYLVTEDGTVIYGNELKFLNNYFSTFLRTRLNAITKSYFEVASLIRFNGDIGEEQGHAWATTPHPTIDDDHVEGSPTEIGDKIFSFSSRLTSLTPGLTYYVRPYTKNKWGVAYGNEIVLKIPTEIITGNWDEINVAEAGLFHYNIYQQNDVLYFITGTFGTSSSGEFRRESYSVNLATNEVKILAEYPGTEASPDFGFVIDSKLYVKCGSQYVNDDDCLLFWMYDPAIDEWSLNSFLEPYYVSGVRFSGTFEDYGYFGSVNADGYLYLSMYIPESDYWFVADAIPVPDGKFIGSGTATAPGGQFIYFNLSNDIAVYDFYNGGYEIIDFPDPTPPVQSGYPMRFFFHDNQLHVITDVLEVYVLDSFTREWSRRTSIPSLGNGGSLFVGSYQSKPLIGIYYVDDYLSFYLDDYSKWYQYSD
jgi:hypothetical protein